MKLIPLLLLALISCGEKKDKANDKLWHKEWLRTDSQYRSLLNDSNQLKNSLQYLRANHWLQDHRNDVFFVGKILKVGTVTYGPYGESTWRDWNIDGTDSTQNYRWTFGQLENISELFHPKP